MANPVKSIPEEFLEEARQRAATSEWEPRKGTPDRRDNRDPETLGKEIQRLRGTEFELQRGNGFRPGRMVVIPSSYQTAHEAADEVLGR